MFEVRRTMWLALATEKWPEVRHSDECVNSGGITIYMVGSVCVRLSAVSDSLRPHASSNAMKQKEDFEGKIFWIVNCGHKISVHLYWNHVDYTVIGHTYRTYPRLHCMDVLDNYEFI